MADEKKASPITNWSNDSVSINVARATFDNKNRRSMRGVEHKPDPADTGYKNAEMSKISRGEREFHLEKPTENAILIVLAERWQTLQKIKNPSPQTLTEHRIFRDFMDAKAREEPGVEPDEAKIQEWCKAYVTDKKFGAKHMAETVFYVQQKQAMLEKFTDLRLDDNTKNHTQKRDPVIMINALFVDAENKAMAMYDKDRVGVVSALKKVGRAVVGVASDVRYFPEKFIGRRNSSVEIRRLVDGKQKQIDRTQEYIDVDSASYPDADTKLLSKQFAEAYLGTSGSIEQRYVVAELLRDVAIKIDYYTKQGVQLKDMPIDELDENGNQKETIIEGWQTKLADCKTPEDRRKKLEEFYKDAQDKIDKKEKEKNTKLADESKKLRDQEGIMQKNAARKKELEGKLTPTPEDFAEIAKKEQEKSTIERKINARKALDASLDQLNKIDGLTDVFSKSYQSLVDLCVSTDKSYFCESNGTLKQGELTLAKIDEYIKNRIKITKSDFYSSISTPDTLLQWLNEVDDTKKLNLLECEAAKQNLTDLASIAEARAGVDRVKSAMEGLIKKIATEKSKSKTGGQSNIDIEAWETERVNLEEILKNKQDDLAKWVQIGIGLNNRITELKAQEIDLQTLLTDVKSKLSAIIKEVQNTKESLKVLGATAVKVEIDVGGTKTSVDIFDHFIACLDDKSKTQIDLSLVALTNAGVKLNELSQLEADTKAKSLEIDKLKKTDAKEQIDQLTAAEELFIGVADKDKKTTKIDVIYEGLQAEHDRMRRGEPPKEGQEGRADFDVTSTLLAINGGEYSVLYLRFAQLITGKHVDNPGNEDAQKALVGFVKAMPEDLFWKLWDNQPDTVQNKIINRRANLDKAQFETAKHSASTIEDLQKEATKTADSLTITDAKDIILRYTKYLEASSGALYEVTKEADLSDIINKRDELKKLAAEIREQMISGNKPNQAKVNEHSKLAAEYHDLKIAKKNSNKFSTFK